MRTFSSLHVFLTLLASTLFIFLFSLAGATTYQTAFQQNRIFAEETSIAGISVGGLSELEATDKIKRELETVWTKMVIHVTHGDQSKEVPHELVIFQVEETVEVALDGQNTPLLVTLNQQGLNSVLSSLTSNILEKINLETFYIELARTFSNLEENTTLSLVDFYHEGLLETKVITEASVPVNNELVNVINQQSEIVVGANSQFSLHEYLQEHAITLSTEVHSQLSTLLYQIILPTNFQIVERHISESLPSNIEIGYEAFSSNELDFKFYNPNEAEYVVQFSANENAVKASLTGPALTYEYTIQLEGKEELKPKTIIHYDSSLVTGKTKVAETGKTGWIVKVFRVTTFDNGAERERQLIAEDYYPPQHKIEIHSLKTVETTTTDESTTVNHSTDSSTDSKDSSDQQQQVDNEDSVTTPIDKTDSSSEVIEK